MSVVADSPAVVAGIDIGGTTTQVVLCDRDRTVVVSGQRPTPAAAGGTAMLAQAAQLTEELLDRSGRRLVAAGVGAAGVIDPVTATVVAASDSFTDWVGVRLGETLRTRLGVPVAVDNDANAFLIGETSVGAAAGLRNAIGIMLGTGVGGTLWLAGGLHRGEHGAAGEIGHFSGFGDEPCTCGQSGHLESLASGRSIARRYRERTGVELAAVAIAERARAGDPAARQVFADAGEALGSGSVIASSLLDVAHVVIGGGVSGAWDLLWPSLDARIRAQPPVSNHGVHVHRSALGTLAVAVGAAELAWQEDTLADPASWNRRPFSGV